MVCHSTLQYIVGAGRSPRPSQGLASSALQATTISLPAGAERVMWRVQTRGPGKLAEKNRGRLLGLGFRV